jgi:ribosomal protein S18 acetylase RimI-like enzyme
MTTPRVWMTLSLRAFERAILPPGDTGIFTTRVLEREDAQRLAGLMLESYRGTVDDGGENLDDARGEVTKLIAGDFGPLDWDASSVVARDGELVHATIITRDRVAPPPLAAGEAFLAFSMTAPAFKRRGLAREVLVRVIEHLRQRGEPRLHLVVTRANTPAVMLYRSLGFNDGPIGEEDARSSAAPGA